MPGLTSRQIQIGALSLASLLVLATFLVYVTLEREVRIAGQQLTHSMEHLEEDVDAIKTALGQLAPVNDQDLAPSIKQSLGFTPIPASGDAQRYVVHDRSFDLKLQLEAPMSSDAERTAFGTFGDITALQFYSHLAQMTSLSTQILIMSRDAQVKISTPCVLKQITLHASRVNACQNREFVWNEIVSRAVNIGDAVQFAVITLPDGSAAGLIHRSIDVSGPGFPTALANQRWIAVAPIDIGISPLTQSEGHEILGARPGHASRVEFYDEAGRNLNSGQSTLADVSPGWSIRSEGLIYRVDGDSGLSIRYVIPYHYYTAELVPRLAAVVILMLVSSIVTLFLARWYLRRFYEPGQRQQRRMEESEAFGRQVIDAAQLAVIVCEWPAGKILRANDVAVEWFGDDASLRAAAVKCTTTHDEADLLPHEGIHLMLGQRHILATYQRTRYEDKGALLCTFRDVSDDVEARETLVRAKQAADESNAAKSMFLATMSHEIRTPLYGALGMLELLAATPMSEVQRGFVRTIQASSDQLLNVIGDVLDMSKIEAGGLTLHEERFSPLDLTEGVVQMYGAKAADKGLFLHCVVDAAVPELLAGDGVRLRQILTNLVSNAIKFTEVGRIVVALTVEGLDDGAARLHWRVSDSGVGLSEVELPHIFEPFYQARSSRLAAGGTGLGLAICHTLAQLMGGGIDVVSQRNVGSTFLVRIPFAVAPSAARTQAAHALDGIKVYVRAPTQELREHYSSWLTKWGALCVTVGVERQQMDASAVLLQIMPEQMSPFPAHARQVFCTQAGPLHPDPILHGWQVNSHAIRSIALAVTLAAGRPSAMSPDEAERPPDPQQAASRLALRVLVVDDSPLNQEVLGRQLQSLDCEVTLCGDPRRALELWSDEAFDLLLTDMNMPEMSGRELVTQLRGRGMKRPAVCVTANAVSEILAANESDSLMNAWLVKPVTVDALRKGLLQACSEAFPNDAASSGPGVAAADDVPDFVRQAFVVAMSADTLALREAVAHQDAQAVRDILHRVRGGLVMANSAGMSQACVRMEADLTASGISPELEIDIDHFIGILQSKIEEVRAAMARDGSLDS